MIKWLAALAALYAIVFAPAAHAKGLSSEQIMKGHLAQRTGDYDTAAEYYKVAVEIDPAAAEPRLRLSRLYLLFGETEQALGVLNKGLEYRPDHPELLINKARTLVLADRKGEAVDVAVKAAEGGGDPKAFGLAVKLLGGEKRFKEQNELARLWVEKHDSAEANFHLGRSFEFLDQDVEAEKYLVKALEKMPTHQQGLEALAKLLVRSGRNAEAIEKFEKLISINPHIIQIRIEFVQLLLDLDRKDEAVAALDEAQKWLPRETIHLLKVGLLNLLANRPQEARTVLEKIDPDQRDARTWFFIGIAELELDNNEKALKALNRIGPESALYMDALIRKTRALQALGKIEQAETDYKKWFQAHPADPDAVLALAALYQEMKVYGKGIKALEDFLANIPADSETTRLLFTLGTLYDKTGDWEKSVELMQGVLEIDPEHPHALNYLGYTYADKGIKLDAAEVMVKKAVELMPGNGYIIDSLGWVYFKQGRTEEAIEALEKAVVLAPEDEVIWEHLGDAKLKLGDKDGAKDAYTKALELKPESQALSGKLDELK